MLITAVTKQKNDPKRVSVYIDEKFAFGISAVDALYYHIEEGKELTREKYEYILNEIIYGKARDKAIKLLGFSPRTEKELMDKLKGDYSEEICQRVLDMLKKYGYINDTQYAASYVKDNFNLKGKGSLRIRSELKHKGINEDTIISALDSAELDEDEKAYTLLKKRLKNNIHPDAKEKAKQYRYLASRGFSYDSINSAFSRLDGSITDDWS